VWSCCCSLFTSALEGTRPRDVSVRVPLHRTSTDIVGHRCLIERTMLGHEFLKLIVTGMRARTSYLYSVNSFVRAFPFSMAIIRNCSKNRSWIPGVSEGDDTLVTFFDRIGTNLRVLGGIKSDYRTSSEQAPPGPAADEPASFIREKPLGGSHERLTSFSASCNQRACGGE
jgi:hypothetical protein